MLAVLTVAPPWRSFLTTLEWPLKDAIISAVAPPLSCEEARRCGGRMSSRVLCCELFECSCAAVHNVELPAWSFRFILKPDSMLQSFEITPLTDLTVVSHMVLHIFLTPVHVLITYLGICYKFNGSTVGLRAVPL